jgi:hypothetical protein
VIGFALGAGLFWSVAAELARPIRPIAGQAVLIAAGLGLFAFAPAVALVLGAEPDWAYAYIVPASELPRWLMPWLVLAAAISVPLGFALSMRACRGRARFVRRWFWVPLAVGAAPLGATAPRLAVQATFEQFHGDFGIRPLVGGPLGYLLVWLFVGLMAATFLARRSLGYLALGAAEDR